MDDAETPTAGPARQVAPVCYRHTGREAHIRCQRCDRPICPDCMRPASVGFQCPSCVSEGARTTRAARTAYGGQRSGNPALTSQVLIALNVLVWVLILATGGNASTLVDRLALTPRGGVLFSRPDGSVFQVTGVADGAPWQLLTSMFTHVQVTHIAFNMVALYVLGPALELAIGRLRFLAVYFVSGLAGSAAVMWFSPTYQLTLGASGAIFGLMGALLVVAIKARGDVRGIATWIAINLVITFVFTANISWQGHLGGLAGGVLLGGAIAYAPRQNRPAWQVAGVAGVATLVAVATVVRVLALQ
jgi:membrane associated rhomboid family serine protease